MQSKILGVVELSQSERDRQLRLKSERDSRRAKASKPPFNGISGLELIDRRALKRQKKVKK